MLLVCDDVVCGVVGFGCVRICMELCHVLWCGVDCVACVMCVYAFGSGMCVRCVVLRMITWCVALLYIASCHVVRLFCDMGCDVMLCVCVYLRCVMMWCVIIPYVCVCCVVL